MPSAKLGEYRRQHFRPYDFTCCNSYNCVSPEILARNLSNESSSRTGHCLRMRLERIGCVSGP